MARVLTEGPLGARASLMLPRWLLTTPYEVGTIYTPDTNWVYVMPKPVSLLKEARSTPIPIRPSSHPGQSI